MKRVLLAPVLVLIAVVLLLVFAWAESQLGYKTFGWAAAVVMAFLAAIVLLCTIVSIRRDGKKNRDN